MTDLEIKVRKAFDEKYPGFDVNYSMDTSVFEATNLGYEYPKNEHMHENDIKENFVGTVAQGKEAISEAKEQDFNAYHEALTERCQVNSVLEYIFEEKSAIAMGMDINSTLWKLVYSKAREEGHSEGYSNVYSKIDEISDFANDIIEASKEV